MARMGSFDSSAFKALAKRLEKLSEASVRDFPEACVTELAGRVLREAKMRTPVGDYHEIVEVVAKRNSKKHKKGDVYTKRVNRSGKRGGTLRDGWTLGTPQRAGDTVSITVFNPVHYASYVEFGHRQKIGRYVPAIGKRLKQGWVNGKFMLTRAEERVRGKSDAIIEARLEKLLREAFKNE